MLSPGTELETAIANLGPHTTPQELADVLIARFDGGWGALLEYGGIVVDHLSDHCPRANLEQIDEDIWDAAWAIYDAAYSR